MAPGPEVPGIQKDKNIVSPLMCFKILKKKVYIHYSDSYLKFKFFMAKVRKYRLQEDKP